MFVIQNCMVRHCLFNPQVGDTSCNIYPYDTMNSQKEIYADYGIMWFPNEISSLDPQFLCHLSIVKHLVANGFC